MNFPEYTPEELAAIREAYAKGASDNDFTLFMAECRQRRLLPGVHVVFQLRSASEYDAASGQKYKVMRATKITTINALRLLANRTGLYRGQNEPQYVYLDDKHQPTIVSEGVPLAASPTSPLIPWAVKVGVYREGFVKPLIATARFDAYAVTKFNGDLTDVWNRRAPEQIAKCAEALALRMAFPEELGDLYLSEEFKDDTPPAPTETQVKSSPATPPPAAIVAPAVNQTPVEPKEAPRPDSDAKPKEKKAKAEPKAAEVVDPNKATKEEIREFGTRIRNLKADRDLVYAWMTSIGKVGDMRDLTREQWADLLGRLEDALKLGPEALVKLLKEKE